MTSAYSQTENRLLDKTFWQLQPTVKQVSQLVEAGNNPAEFNRWNFDPMVLALLNEAPIEVIEYLLNQEGNTVDKRTHDGRIYAHWAAYKGNQAALERFIHEGSNVTQLDDHGFTVATFAAYAGQTSPALYDLMISAGSNLKTEVDLDGANALLLLTPHLSSLDKLEYFIEKGLPLNSTNNKGYNAFDYAAKSGNIPVMQALIEAGIDFQSIRKDGGNATIMASKGMRRAPNGIEVFQFLKSVGVDPAATTSNGENALHLLASSSSDLEVFRYFISAGLSPDASDELGNTPLMKAAARNSVDVVELLAKTTTGINATNISGESALSMAVSGNSLEVVELLIQLGADVHVVDINGNNLSYFLSESLISGDQARFEQIMNALESAGFDFGTTSPNGDNLFHLAAQSGSEVLIKAALQHELDINATNGEGLTPLHIAALKANDDQILKLLISNGADLHSTTEFGETPYDLALENEVLRAQEINLSFLQD
ncbi:MAG: ankyrin repeat domain-containing protein [Bacteroidetes bacterium]|nr:MAG: ankyrin repeat domain-containing protein [Bacteroidota bacterium]